MVALIDSYGNLIIRGFPGEKLGGKYNSRKYHARRKIGAIIARGNAQIGGNFCNKNEKLSDKLSKSQHRDYFRLKAND